MANKQFDTFDPKEIQNLLRLALLGDKEAKKKLGVLERSEGV